MGISVPGNALRVSADIFRQEFAENGLLSGILLDYANRFIVQISHYLACNACHTVEQRFCCRLLMLSRRSSLLKLPLTQEQVA